MRWLVLGVVHVNRIVRTINYLQAVIPAPLESTRVAAPRPHVRSALPGRSQSQVRALVQTVRPGSSMDVGVVQIYRQLFGTL